MQTTSQTWKTLFASNSYVADYKLVVNNFEYDGDYLVNGEVTTTCDLFSGGSPSVGNCISTQMSVSLYLQSGDIAKRSACQLYVRLKDGNTVSEWLPHGTYYIDKRSTSNNGVLTLKTYDAMLKGDQLMYTSEGDQGEWPKTDIQVATLIATRLGVTLDSSVSDKMTHGYSVGYPGYGDNGYTVREVLGYIGAMYAGNWIITEDNKLKLIKLEPPTATEYEYDISTNLYTYTASDSVGSLEITGDAPGTGDNPIDISDAVEDYSNSTESIRYSRVTIDVGSDDEGNSIYYTAGTDTYDELSFTCPWGTQAMANNLVSELSSFIYRPFTGTNAVLDPAFQLGDAVIADGVQSTIYSYTRYYELLFTADISATVEEEMDSEYPYVTTSELEEKRTNAKVQAQLYVNASNISSEVSTRSDLFNGLSSQITDVENDIEDMGTKITQTQESVTIESTRAKGAEDAITKYVRYEDGTVTLGQEDNPYQAKLTNNRLSFVYNDNEVSYISSDKLYITKSEIVSEQKIGNIVFIAKSDGSVSLKWRSS